MHLHIESDGQGRDIVLLHGWGMSGKCWDPVFCSLAQKFRVHRVDLPGHGSSRHCSGDWVEILAQAFPSEVFLCGWSLGGQLALQWAERYPERIGRLALVSSTPGFVSRGNWTHGIAEEAFSEFADALESNPEGTLKRFLFLQAQGGEDAAGIFRKLQGYLGNTEMAALKKGLDLLLNSDLRKAAQSVTLPALVLHGECDRLTPIAAGKWLAENMPDGRLESISGCAHAPFISHPECFVSKLTEFFDES